MKKIFPLSLLALIFAALPVDASLTVSEGIKLKGSILSVKTTKKYTSVEGCKLLAEKKSKAVAFNLDTSEGKCYLLKSVTGSTNSASVVSGSWPPYEPYEAAYLSGFFYRFFYFFAWKR